MPEVDPDRLLKQLDADLERMRAARAKRSGGGPALRIWGLVLCSAVLIALLWGMQLFLTQMFPRPMHGRAAGSSAESRREAR